MAAAQRNDALEDVIEQYPIASPICARICLEDFMEAARVIGTAMHSARRTLRCYFIGNVDLFEAIVEQFVQIKANARRILPQSFRRNGRLYFSQNEYLWPAFDNYTATLEYLGNLILFPNLIQHHGERTRRYTWMKYDFMCCRAYITSIRFDRVTKKFVFTYTNGVAIM